MFNQHRIAFVFALFVLAFTLAACGKKAGQLDAPGEGEDHFPLTYPDPATDPKPELPQ